MDVVFTNQNQKLRFNECSQSVLLAQLNKDAAFQKRIKVIVTVALGVLFIGGAIASGVGIAGVVPYSLLHTLLVAGGTGCATFGIIALTAEDMADSLIAYCTSLPLCSKLKEKINSDEREITDKASWKYLQKFIEVHISPPSSRESEKNDSQ